MCFYQSNFCFVRFLVEVLRRSCEERSLRWEGGRSLAWPASAWALGQMPRLGLKLFLVRTLGRRLVNPTPVLDKWSWGLYLTAVNKKKCLFWINDRRMFLWSLDGLIKNKGVLFWCILSFENWRIRKCWIYDRVFYGVWMDLSRTRGSCFVMKETIVFGKGGGRCYEPPCI